MYFSLHNHTDRSNFRLRDSINRIPELINYAHELGLKGVCFTEHETISNAIAVENYFETVKDKPDWKDFKVALGNEIYLCDEAVCKENASEGIRFKFPHFLLIALDAEGHKQLRELSTRAWKRAFVYRNQMRVPTYFSDIEAVIGDNRGHVVASTACLGGSLPGLILANKNNVLSIIDTAAEWISIMKETFGEGYFFLELQPSDNPDQVLVNNTLIHLSEITNTPYVITTDSHYLKKEDSEIHSIYLKSDDGDREVASFYATTYMMSPAEIHEYMDKYLGEDKVNKGLENTSLIYDMVQSYSLKKPLHIPYMVKDATEPDEQLFDKYVPFIPMLKPLYESSEPCDRHMVREILNALEKDESFRNEKMYEHLNICLDTIIKSSEKMNTHWSAYLLDVAEYIKVAWDKGDTLVGAARGSGCGFGLLNVLGITQINPLNETTRTFFWRFLNPERASVLDVDCDIQSNKRDSVISAFKETFGEDRVSKVLTYTTEGSRAAVLTMARGLGIDNDIASYIASLVVADRGMTRSLKALYYGDEDHNPVPEFKRAMDDYPELFEGALKIEGLISGMGSHAGGVIFVDEPFTETTALMKTNSGDLVTQFDLHESEDCSLIKIDLLSIEALDKMRAEMDLLLEDGVIEWQGSLKATYEKYIGIKTLERDDPEMWKLLHEHKVLSLFQMEKDSGIKAISLIKPTSVDQLATMNSVIRLMAQEEGAEAPLNKYARFVKDPSLWDEEMEKAGLVEEEKQIIIKHLTSSGGVCAFQEQIMNLVMEPAAGGYSLAWADKLRKAVAKKNPKGFMELEKEFIANAKEKKLSKNFIKYVWYELIYTQRGYSFNSAHTLSYSLIALQELNLCHKYPIIYWNTANLIVDSGSSEGTDKTTDYGKMAVAIANIQSNGIKIERPEINSSRRGFKPDAERDEILFGLKAINGIGDDDVEKIISNRPYKSFDDFCERMIETKLITNSSMISLIKAGCFTQIDSPDRRSTMNKYLRKYVFSPNEKLTMANFRKIAELELIPKELTIASRMVNFKAYVLQDKFYVRSVIKEGKKIPKAGYHDRLFRLDNDTMPFFTQYLPETSVVEIQNDKYIIAERQFIKDCDEVLQKLKDWLASEETLKAYNDRCFKEVYDRFASGTDASWDMDVLSYYYDKHELDGLDLSNYGVVNYFSLPEQPKAYDSYTRYTNDGPKQIPKFQIVRLAGTVIKNDNFHHVISLLTVDGVVNVKFNKGQYAFYNQQISERLDENSDKKTVLDKSWFKKGTLLLVCGYRQDDVFRAYKYKDTVYLHTVNKIEHINEDGTLDLFTDRVGTK